MKALLTAAGFVALALVIGCGGDDEDEELPNVDCGEGTIPTYDEVAAFDTCNTCHSSELSGAARAEAPSDVNFNTYDAAKKSAEEAAAEVHEGAMPPAPLAPLSADARDQLYKWALCGTPE